MEVKYRNILVLSLATIMFFVGVGVTVVDLCCSGCSQEENISMNHPDGTPLCMNAHLSKCCEIKRISIDLDHSVYHPNLLYSMAWTMIPAFVFDHLLISDNKGLLVREEAQDPVPIPPRNYLSLIRVLII